MNSVLAIGAPANRGRMAVLAAENLLAALRGERPAGMVESIRRR